MKIMSLFQIIMLNCLLLSNNSWADDSHLRTGDVGNGGGRSSTISGKEFKIVSPQELIKRPMTVADYVRLDEMAMMGDVGTGGGVGRWLKRLKYKISRRLNGVRRPQELRALQGKNYRFIRQQLPLQEFNSFEMGHISALKFSTFGLIQLSEVYALHFQQDADAELGPTLQHLYAVELLDGTILLANDISEVVVTLYFGDI